MIPALGSSTWAGALQRQTIRSRIAGMGSNTDRPHRGPPISKPLSRQPFDHRYLSKAAIGPGWYSSSPGHHVGINGSRAITVPFGSNPQALIWAVGNRSLGCSKHTS